MSRPRPLPPDLRHSPFRGSIAMREGVLSENQLRGKNVRRLMQDVYADADLPVDHAVRIAATRLVMPEPVAIAGRSAAWLHGVRLVGPKDPVEVVAEEDTRRHPRGGIRVHTGFLPVTDTMLIEGWRATTPARTCVDAARWYQEERALELVDAMLAAQVVTLTDLDRQLEESVGRGLGRVRRLLPLADGRAESPPESVLRLRVIRAGFPPPEPQIEVRHCGLFVARVDLGWREAKVALEYDGAWHGDPAQFAGDRRRLNALVAAGWTVIFVTSADMRDLSRVWAQLRQALRTAA